MATLEWEWKEEIYNEATETEEFIERLTTVDYELSFEADSYNKRFDCYEQDGWDLNILDCTGDKLTDYELDNIYDTIMNDPYEF